MSEDETKKLTARQLLELIWKRLTKLEESRDTRPLFDLLRKEIMETR
jgi:hypothetical protein